MQPDVFSELTEDEWQELEPLFRPTTYADGDYLFHQGEHATGAYLIDGGTIELELSVPGSEPRVVYRVGAGQLLGEPALLTAVTRQLGGRAVGEVTTRFVEQVDFRSLRNSFRPAAFKVMLAIARMTARRLQEADELETELSGGYPDATDDLAGSLREGHAPGVSFDPRPFLPLLPFFHDFGQTGREAFLGLVEAYEVPRGHEVVRFGQRSDRCWIVLRGAVEVLNPKTRRRVALLGPGKLFGQLAPLLGARTIATCRVREDAVLLELGPESLGILLTPRERVSFRFLDALALDLIQGLQRAHRVLARTTKEHDVQSHGVLGRA